jgi:hypothetical protein
MVRSEGNMSLKNPVTLPGANPGTVRLVAQRINLYVTPGPWNEVIDSHILSLGTLGMWFPSYPFRFIPKGKHRTKYI